MRKRSRLHVRWPEPDAALVRTAASRLDISVSELVRRAAVAAAVEAIRSGVIPTATATAGQADGRSAE
ncbi:MAG: hypothetical protein WEA09_13025 [Gemmatimonadota bacterium]